MCDSFKMQKYDLVIVYKAKNLASRHGVSGTLREEIQFCRINHVNSSLNRAERAD